jgi:hypothetical protein
MKHQHFPLFHIHYQLFLPHILSQVPHDFFHFSLTLRHSHKVSVVRKRQAANFLPNHHTPPPPLVLSLAFRPRIHCEQSLQSTDNPSPLHAPFIISTILSSVLSVPYTHASFCTLSFPGAFLYFRFLISLSTSSTVISVPSGAVYFLFVSVSAFATTFLSSAIS